MQHPTLAALALAGFVLWRIYARVRRLVGRQRSQLWRHRVTMLGLPVLLGVLGLGSLDDPKALLALAAGVLAGLLIGVAGLRLTRFEVTADGPFYTPYAPIGIALSAIIVGRLSYSALQVVEKDLAHNVGPRVLAVTPVTLLIFGTIASYLTVYAIGLLRWRRRIDSGTVSASQA